MTLFRVLMTKIILIVVYGVRLTMSQAGFVLVLKRLFSNII